MRCDAMLTDCARSRRPISLTLRVEFDHITARQAEVSHARISQGRDVTLIDGSKTSDDKVCEMHLSVWHPPTDLQLFQVGRVVLLRNVQGTRKPDGVSKFRSSRPTFAPRSARANREWREQSTAPRRRTRLLHWTSCTPHRDWCLRGQLGHNDRGHALPLRPG